MSAGVHRGVPEAAATPSVASRPLALPSRSQRAGTLHCPSGQGHLRAELGMSQRLHSCSPDFTRAQGHTDSASHLPAPAPSPPVPAVRWDSHGDAGPQFLDVLRLVDFCLTKCKQLHTEGMATREAQGMVLVPCGQQVTARGLRPWGTPHQVTFPGPLTGTAVPDTPHPHPHGRSTGEQACG